MARPAGAAAALAPEPPLASLADGLLVLAIATLPLTQALTLDIGFPLKLSEPLLALALVTRIIGGGHVVLTRGLRWGLVWAPVLLAATAVATAAALLDANRPSDRGLYRLAPSFDALLQLGYLALAVVTLLLVAELAQRRPYACLRWWLRGAAFAAVYGVLVNAASVAGVRPVLLPNASSQVANLLGGVVYRAGTFLEGNFFGLYLLTSLVLALLVGRRGLALLLSVALLLSLSTLSIAGAAVVWFVATVRDLRTGASAAAAALSVLPVLLLALLLPGEFYRTVVLEKLQDPRSQSSLERRATAVAGLEMFVDKPATGVGLAQYGLWFPEYRPSYVPEDFLPPGKRYIANNVYVQVLAEQGAAGSVPFALLLGGVVVAALRSRASVMISGVAVVMLGLNAFPSVTVLFLWAFFGLVIGLADWQQAQRVRSLTALRFGRPRNATGPRRLLKPWRPSR